MLILFYLNIDIKKNDTSKADYFFADVGEQKDMTMVLDKIYKKYERLDLICCNAGIAADDDAFASESHWKSIIKTNLLQHTILVRYCVPKMLCRNKGWFLITASAAGLLSQVGSATYSTTKHATVGYAEWLAITYGEKNIGVSLLCPQGVSTAMTENLKNGGVAGIDGMLEAKEVASITLDAMKKGKFLITPHPKLCLHYCHLLRLRREGAFDALRRNFGCIAEIPDTRRCHSTSFASLLAMSHLRVAESQHI